MILARVGDKEQNKTVNMAEIAFFRGVSEIQCVIFQQSNVNPSGTYNELKGYGNIFLFWLIDKNL